MATELANPTPAAPPSPAAPSRVLVLACGALVRELQDILAMNGLDHVTLECLPAQWHMTPERIPSGLRQRLADRTEDYDQVLIGYADCGTAGEIDLVAQEFGASRIPGEHCFEFFAGREHFAELHDADPGTFYLTDYLARYFDRLVIQALGIDRHPELLDAYFGNYNRVVYLSQQPDPGPELMAAAQRAAAQLGLAFEHRPSGFGELEEVVVSFAGSAPADTGSLPHLPPE